MFTAKFIKNIFLEADSIKAIGRSGKLTKVFAQQGDLDGSCGIYSLMMMLIFHKFLDWEDLLDFRTFAIWRTLSAKLEEHQTQATPGHFFANRMQLIPLTADKRYRSAYTHAIFEAQSPSD